MSHKLFPYSEQERCSVVNSLDCSEEGLKEDVDAIIDWFYKQPHLVEAGIDRDTVRTFLLMSIGSREKAKQRIVNFYKYRALAPELIQSRVEALSNSHNLWNCTRHAAILKLYDGRRVTVFQLLQSDPSTFSTQELFRNLYLINDLRVKYDCFRGDIWVIDLKYATLGHLLRFNLTLGKKAAHIFQDGLGFKVHAIHILNFPSIGRKIIDFFRNFVKAKIMDRIMIHSSIEDLHNVLPKQFLPKDYGGEDFSMQEYTDMYEKEFRSEPTKQYLLNACKHISDMKKQPGAYINEEYCSGTFKKLNLD